MWRTSGQLAGSSSGRRPEAAAERERQPQRPETQKDERDRGEQADARREPGAVELAEIIESVRLGRALHGLGVDGRANARRPRRWSRAGASGVSCVEAGDYVPGVMTRPFTSERLATSLACSPS